MKQKDWKNSKQKTRKKKKPGKRWTSKTGNRKARRESTMFLRKHVMTIKLIQDLSKWPRNKPVRKD